MSNTFKVLNKKQIKKINKDIDYLYDLIRQDLHSGVEPKDVMRVSYETLLNMILVIYTQRATLKELGQ